MPSRSLSHKIRFAARKICVNADLVLPPIVLLSGKVSNAIIKKMEDGLKYTHKYFDRWKIKVNVSKMHAIIFPYNRSQKRNPTKHLYSRRVFIPLQDNIKYLGIILDKKLSFKHHIQ